MSKTHVLVAGNSSIVRDYYCDLLKIKGFEGGIWQFSSSEKIFAFLDVQKKTDNKILILLNTPLVDVSTSRFLDWLESNLFRKQCKVIVITSNKSPLEMKQMAAFKTVAFFLNKPMNSKKMDSIINHSQLNHFFMSISDKHQMERCERCYALNDKPHPTSGFLVRLEVVDLQGKSEVLCQKCKIRRISDKKHAKPNKSSFFELIINKINREDNQS